MAYSTSDIEHPTRVEELVGRIAAPGKPFRGLPDSFEPEAIRAAGRRQANCLNAEEGQDVADGRVIVAFLKRGEVIFRDIGAIRF